MSEKRFVMVEVEDPLWEYGTPTKCVLQDNQTGKQYEYVSRTVDLLNSLVDENEQLRQILKDIVSVTDETYTKDKNIYKVTVVFDSEKYLKIRECLT